MLMLKTYAASYSILSEDISQSGRYSLIYL